MGGWRPYGDVEVLRATKVNLRAIAAAELRHDPCSGVIVESDGCGGVEDAGRIVLLPVSYEPGLYSDVF